MSLLFSAIAVTLVLLLPEQYQKQFSISTNVVPVGQLEGSQQSLPQLAPDQVGESVAYFLRSGGLGRQIYASATYNDVTRQVDVVLRSRDEGSLDEASARLMSPLESALITQYEEPLSGVLQAKQAGSEAEAETTEAALARIERQIEQSTSADADEGLEGARADLISQVALAESRQEYLEQARSDLPRLISESILVDIESETETAQRPRPIAVLVVLALLASFAAAVALVFVWSSLLRGGRVFSGG